MSTARTIIVTGASRGIGLSICQTLLRSGNNVLGVSRSQFTSLPALSALASLGGKFEYLSLDITADDAGKRIVDTAVQKFGSLDAVVHNAGVLDPIAPLSSASLPDFKHCMDVNVFAGLSLIQSALPHLRSSRSGGRIVVVSSGAATKPYKGWGAYCVAKAACNMLVAGLGEEEQDVVSVAVRPGVVDTEMQRVIRDTGRDAMGDANHSKFVELNDGGNLLHPDVPGHVIAHLALRAPKELSGRFLSWDDAALDGFQKPSA
ncbi:hypothetical protein HKX48_002567 [Thoreauomyces humboldtii]|nr:hypothetical protein HKX48_002567 [Thoreauomyces humboldtii]